MDRWRKILVVWVGFLAWGTGFGATTAAAPNQVCWVLEPFIDTLELTYETRKGIKAPKNPTVVKETLTFEARWAAEPFYRFEGAGQGAWTPDQTRVLVTLTVHPGEEGFFEGNPLGRLTMVVDLATSGGRWVSEFVGLTVPALTAEGTLAPIDCAARRPVQAFVTTPDHGGGLAMGLR